MTRIHTPGVVILWLWLAGVAPALGQSGGSISGTITNSAGAEVPGASIVVKSASTSLERTVVSDKDGFYSVPNLISGNYEVIV